MGIGAEVAETDERLGRTVPPVFALAEALTGIRITESLLTASILAGGFVTMPG